MKKQVSDNNNILREQPINEVVEDDPEEENGHNVPNFYPRKDSYDLANFNNTIIDGRFNNNQPADYEYQSVKVKYIQTDDYYAHANNFRLQNNNNKYRNSKLLQEYIDENIPQIIENEKQTESQKSQDQNFVSSSQLIYLQPDDEKWTQAALEIFNSIFQEQFIAAEQKLNQIDPVSRRVFINKKQFEHATQQVDEIEHLLELFNHADHNKNGKIFKNDLVEVLKLDLMSIYQAIQISDSEQVKAKTLQVPLKQDKDSMIFQTCKSVVDLQESQDNENNNQLTHLNKQLTERGRNRSTTQEFEIEYQEKIRLKDFDQSAKKLEKIYENADGELQQFKIELQKNRINNSPESKEILKKGAQENEVGINEFENRRSNIIGQSNSIKRRKRSQSWRNKSNQISYNCLIEQTLHQSQQTFKIVNANYDEAYTKNESPDLKLIEEQANSILNEIFALYFDSEDKIQLSQYEQAINSYFVSASDVSKLKELFQIADSNQIKQVSRIKLLHVFKEDLIRYQKNIRQSQITDSWVSEDIQRKSQNQNYEFNNQIAKHIVNIEKSQKDPKDDPILNLLAQTIQQPDSLCQSIQNLTQTIEYIKLYKLEDYHNQLGHLKHLFNILYDSSLIVQQQVDNQQKLDNRMSLQRKSEVIEPIKDTNKNLKIVQQVQIENENLKNELDRLYQYENLYHTQLGKLNLFVSEKIELEQEKENLKALNQEILTEFEQSKQQHETLLLKYKKEVQDSQGLRVQIESLKKQVLQKFNLSDSEQDQFERNDINQKGETLFEDYDVEEDSNYLSPNKNNISLDNQMIYKQSLSKNKNSYFSYSKSTKQQGTFKHSKHKSSQKILNLNINQQNLLVDKQNKSLIYYKHEQKQSHSILNQKYATDEELQIVQDLETTEVFKIRDRIKSYLQNTIRLERQGISNQLKDFRKKQSQLKQQVFEKDIKLSESNRELSSVQNLCQNLQIQLSDKNTIIDQLKNQLLEECHQKEKLEQAKKRLMGANQILEQKIRVEKSEKMSLISEVIHADRFDDGKSVRSGKSHFSAISGLTSRYGNGRMTNLLQHHNKKSRQTTNFSGARGTLDMKSLRSDNQWFNQKYEYSQYKDRIDENSFDGLSNNSNQLSNKNQEDILNKSQSLFEYQSTRQFNQKPVQNQIRYNNSLIEQKSFQGLSQTEQKLEQAKNVYKNYLGTSQKSFKQDTTQNNQCSRVQVISDFGSQSSSQSIADHVEMDKINKSLQVIQQEQLTKNSKGSLDCDFLKIKDISNPLNQLIKEFLDSQNKDRKNYQCKDLINQSNLFSDSVKIYDGSTLKNAILLMIQDQLHLFFKEEGTLTYHSKPISFLDEIDRIIYSDRHPNYLAIKMMKQKTQSHIVLETENKKESIFEYMVDFSISCDDDIIMEQNDEFSVQFQQGADPVWFSFDDISRLKTQIESSEKQPNVQEFSGNLEIKVNNTLNIFKSLFQGQKVLWESKFVILRDIRLFIYTQQKQNQNFTKPDRVIRLTQNFQISEIRKADIQGKLNVFQICTDSTIPSNLQESLFVSAQNSETMNKWIKQLQSVRQIFQEMQNQQQIQEEKQCKQKKEEQDFKLKKYESQLEVEPLNKQEDQSSQLSQEEKLSKQTLKLENSINYNVFGFEQMQIIDGAGFSNLRLKDSTDSNFENIIQNSSSNKSSQSYSVINDELPSDQIQNPLTSSRSLEKARRGRASRCVNKKPSVLEILDEKQSSAIQKNEINKIKPNASTVFVKSPIIVKDSINVAKSQLLIPTFQKQKANLPHHTNLPQNVSQQFTTKNNGSMQNRNLQLINSSIINMSQKMNQQVLKKDDHKIKINSKIKNIVQQKQISLILAQTQKPQKE